MKSSIDIPPLITVDSHVHILPLKLATKIRSFFEATGLITSIPPDSCCSTSTSTSTSNSSTVGKIIKTYLMYPVNPKALVKVLIEEAASTSTTTTINNKETTTTITVGKLWVLPYTTRGGLSTKLNEEVIVLCKELSNERQGVTLIPGCTVHAGDGDSIGAGNFTPEEVLEVAVKNGARVCKLHCSVGAYSVLDSRLVRFWKLAEALKLPVVIHAGASEKGTTAFNDLHEIGTLCSLYPKSVIILAHSGHPNTAKAFELTLDHHNLYLDTTPVISSFPSYPPSPDFFTLDSPFKSQSIHQHIISLALRGRILFGSDTPTTAILRKDAAEEVRNFVRICTNKSMGSMKIEDVGGEMNRVADKCERLILGEAADLIQEDVRSLSEAMELLGWDKVKSKI